MQVPAPCQTEDDGQFSVPYALVEQLTAALQHAQRQSAAFAMELTRERRQREQCRARTSNQQGRAICRCQHGGVIRDRLLAKVSDSPAARMGPGKLLAPKRTAFGPGAAAFAEAGAAASPALSSATVLLQLSGQLILDKAAHFSGVQNWGHGAGNEAARAIVSRLAKDPLASSGSCLAFSGARLRLQTTAIVGTSATASPNCTMSDYVPADVSAQQCNSSAELEEMMLDFEFAGVTDASEQFVLIRAALRLLLSRRRTLESLESLPSLGAGAAASAPLAAPGAKAQARKQSRFSDLSDLLLDEGAHLGSLNMYNKKTQLSGGTVSRQTSVGANQHGWKLDDASRDISEIRSGQHAGHMATAYLGASVQRAQEYAAMSEMSFLRCQPSGGGIYSLPDWSYGPRYAEDTRRDLRHEWR
ncbi:unnamed protein product [Symbiodinium sp. CCMP2592]|nr:unnamed protein product [Symbiodinium sp. CCMP2592]